MECEVPEVVVFLEENDCQLYKYICIDGEVPCDDKCCVENCELDHNNISNLLKYELDKTSIDGSEEVLLYISTSTEESFSNHDSIKDDVKFCGAQNKLMEDKVVIPLGSDVSTGASCSEKELQNPTARAKITNFSLFELFKSDDLREKQQSNQEDPNTETILADSWPAKEADCRSINGTDPRSEVDLGAERITNASGSQLVTNDNISRSTKSAGVEQTPKAENISGMAEDMSKVPLLASSLSCQTTVGRGELGSSRLSAASTPSGRLTFSGLDSISIRSNSTASTRSFAFPILTTEWNESPIRMAEVDRRRPTGFKNHGCWRICFTCSKF